MPVSFTSIYFTYFNKTQDKDKHLKTLLANWQGVTNYYYIDKTQDVIHIFTVSD